ncbi:trimeric intracellular cation channel family protein [Caenispirillum bisanense]|uniref:trimeric intracellular cation channel family protein n=1 Tax=Caenispirillum bisanense TaxID=414052 RepID=UPI0031E4892E
MTEIPSVVALQGFIAVLEVLGVAVFALSGALTAARKEMDPFGFMVLGVATAVGGGTLRDLVLGLPVFWVAKPHYLVACIVASLPVFWLARLLDSRYKALVWADAVGMALFTVTGTQKALEAGAPPSVAITMGIMTAAFGGLIRDILCGESPLMLRKEIYATAAFIGAAALVVMTELEVPREVRAMAAFGITFVVRALAILRGWSLPHYRRPDKPLDGPPKWRP